jgi:hypothetical protein
MPGCLALVEHVKPRLVTLVCRTSVTPFFKAVSGLKHYVEYGPDQRSLFSGRMTEIGGEIARGHYDICVVFERNPHPALLFLCGQSGAALRIGFADAGGYPFLNMRIRPSRKPGCSSDRGMVLVSMLCAQSRKKITPAIDGRTRKKVDRLLQQTNITPATPLAGIDADFFLRRFGPGWTGSLVDMVRRNNPTCRIFSWEKPDAKASRWLDGRNISVLSPACPSETVELIRRADFIIAGATMLFTLADLLHRPVVGVLSNRRSEAFCAESETTRTIRCAGRPDRSAIDAIERHLAGFPAGLSDST